MAKTAPCPYFNGFSYAQGAAETALGLRLPAGGRRDGLETLEPPRTLVSMLLQMWERTGSA